MRPGTRESSLAVAVASLDWMWIEERRGWCGGGVEWSWGERWIEER